MKRFNYKYTLNDKKGWPLFEKFDVDVTPYIIITKKGTFEEVRRHRGIINKDNLLKLLDSIKKKQQK